MLHILKAFQSSVFNWKVIMKRVFGFVHIVADWARESMLNRRMLILNVSFEVVLIGKCLGAKGTRFFLPILLAFQRNQFHFFRPISPLNGVPFGVMQLAIFVKLGPAFVAEVKWPWRICCWCCCCCCWVSYGYFQLCNDHKQEESHFGLHFVLQI